MFSESRLPLIIVLFLSLFSSCKDTSVAPQDFGYDYFPVQIGRFIEYEVDSVFHDCFLAQHDTFHFQLKEVYESSFIDNEGHEAWRIERYKRDSSNHSWNLKDIWTANRTVTTAERVEENERFIRLVFPVREDKFWDGNAQNTRNEWEYKYAYFDEPGLAGGILFDSTLRVNQRNQFIFTGQEIAWEIYAKHVGLIEKEETLITFYADSICPGPSISGTETHWTVTNYGIE